MDAVSETPRTFAFIFGLASGHINPSFPVARKLVEMGHKVHYLSREQQRAPIEDTGATFHSDIELLPELYEGREADNFGAGQALCKELGLEKENPMLSMMKTRTLGSELMVPGVIRFLRSINCDAVLYDALQNMEAPYACHYLGIPTVSLITLAGPGAFARTMEEFFAACGLSVPMMYEAQSTFQPHLDSVKRLNETYGLQIQNVQGLEPLGKMDVFDLSYSNLVTTCETLQDPMTDEMREAYKKSGTVFEAVGPLLDKAGAKRGAGHRTKEEASSSESDEEKAATKAAGASELLQQIRLAKQNGRPIVYVSMGTMITGDSPFAGWHSKIGNVGEERGLTGRELCQSVWGGAFDAFGKTEPSEGPLLVISLGPQENPLGDLVAPANAICLPVIPQVDVLREEIDLFVTHGGQNSFMEALSYATPLVVCPGFGDQVVNAKKAVALGVGSKVDRPHPEQGQEGPAAAEYRAEVAAAAKSVFGNAACKVKAQVCADDIRNAGGVDRAAQVMLEACAHKKSNVELNPVAEKLANARPSPVLAQKERLAATAGA